MSRLTVHLIHFFILIGVQQAYSQIMEHQDFFLDTRSRDPHECCIVCGVMIIAIPDPTFDDHEEWKQFTDLTSAMTVQAKELESFYFHKEPWLWMHLYRTGIMVSCPFSPFTSIYFTADGGRTLFINIVIKQFSINRRTTTSQSQGLLFTS